MHDATEILDKAEAEKANVREHVRDAADWFHDREGEMIERDETRDLLADDLNVDDDVAQSLIAELVGDDVDPITQVRANGSKYVGVAEFKEFDGAYGYLDYHDLHGKRNRVICAQCVHEATYDTEVTHATAGDPEGSYGPNADYSDLLEGIHDHYEDAHDVIPKKVETGASLVSGTTIGGNTAWHAGNDGSGSGLDADTVDGTEANDLQISMATDSGSFTESKVSAESATVHSVSFGNVYDPNKVSWSVGCVVFNHQQGRELDITFDSWNTNSNGNVTGMDLYISRDGAETDGRFNWMAFGETV